MTTTIRVHFSFFCLLPKSSRRTLRTLPLQPRDSNSNSSAQNSPCISNSFRKPRQHPRSVSRLNIAPFSTPRSSIQLSRSRTKTRLSLRPEPISRLFGTLLSNPTSVATRRDFSPSSQTPPFDPPSPISRPDTTPPSTLSRASNPPRRRTDTPLRSSFSSRLRWMINSR